MIPAFGAIIGQERALELLGTALDRPRHAYLFVGPGGVGKRTTALAWTRALFCTAGTGCGDCVECRTFDHGNHPDFHLWQVPEGKRQTTIEQAREVIRQAELAPFRSRYQVHLLWADTLNVQAANCLLKTLEEPTPRTVLILLAQSLSDLLPTVISRCQRVVFGPVCETVLASWLLERHAVTAHKAQQLARQAKGSVRNALALLSAAELPTTRLLFMTDTLDALAEAEAIADQPAEWQAKLLEDLIDQIRDALVLSATGNQDQVARPQVAQQLVATGRSTRAWHATLRRLEATRSQLADSGNSKLLWTVLAGDLAQLQAS
ncbi:MAG: DNA polymerase III subunit, partial [Cyanobacteria bacterium REEB65]|nr:DNA polymerase III subunit [Cyanobacteria bacterium REEB65]